MARLKGEASLLDAVEPAVAFYEEPPIDEVAVETPWNEVVVAREDWREAFESIDPGTPHNEAQADVWEALLDILVDQHGTGDDLDAGDVRAALAADEELRHEFRKGWPILDAAELLADLWSVPAYLRRCAPWLHDDERGLLRRPEGSALTTVDLPLLDAMRRRLGDPRATAIRRRRTAALAENRSFMDDVVSNLLEANDDPDSPLPLLNRDSIREALIDEDVAPTLEGNPLDGPFGHVIVDEAQELTDAQWQMVLARCPSRSVTVVGDRAQARDGFAETWEERLRRVGFGAVTRRTLGINYRTPREVMLAAEPVIREALPDANVPTSVREGLPVRQAKVGELRAIVDDWLAANDDGVAAIIGDPTFVASDRVSVLTPELAKGLEFDLVVLVRPEAFGPGARGAVDRYVAMTRTTGQLVLLH